ncbi:LytTR family transcriptional regulator [Sphingomonas sp. So64.6b]|uniref:LytTR family DNA-binding domain-containing protein n=1 Tax=Sphingomonas sp. So64.6b TaxID=2997354 RepID=UPI0016025B77|nr:LytTR family DNA-binding domain-containing protein [Sphingomonas sp. So64.6b]QNA86019.1 LytTR family transcriptional regulator [Sphingomonas sp. So64.6b]
MTHSGTSGGDGGTTGARRRLVLLLGAGFTVILIAITIANAESMMSDFASAGIAVTRTHVWVWEVSSIIAWLSLAPPVWYLIAKVRPPRFTWVQVALILVLATVPVSAWHIGLMIVLRKAFYAFEGQAYHFFGPLKNALIYEYRKDVGTYLQWAGMAAVAQWLLANADAAAAPREEPGAAFLAVADGSVTHQVPVAEIDQLTAAGNYVEISWGTRTLLHRATLAAVEAELGDAFVRIHRSRIVRRGAIRRVETDRSGDFTIDLASGVSVRGSRRFRAGVQA